MSVCLCLWCVCVCSQKVRLRRATETGCTALCALPWCHSELERTSTGGRVRGPESWGESWARPRPRSEKCTFGAAMAAWGQSRGKRQAARRRNFVRKGVVCVGGWFVKPHADWGEGGGHARKRRADTHEPPHGSRWECRHVGRHAGRICVRGVGCAWAARVSGRKWPSMWLLRASNGRSRRIATGPRNGHQPSPPSCPTRGRGPVGRHDLPVFPCGPWARRTKRVGADLHAG